MVGDMAWAALTSAKEEEGGEGTQIEEWQQQNELQNS